MANQENLISIIIPAYNVEPYLSDCLDSCLKQDYPKFEIVVINDGSTDHTAKICQTYAEKYSNIKILDQKNAGLSAARNRGIKEAKGEYLCLVDGDDCIAPDFLSRLYETAKKTAADLAICDFTEFSTNHPPSNSPETKNPLASTPQPTPTVDTAIAATTRLLTEQENRDIIACNKLYKTELFNDITYPVGALHEDNLTTYKLFAAATKIASLPEPLYFYRKHPGSITDQQDLLSRLQTKEQAAQEAIAYFRHNKALYPAAEISLLLAKFAYLDNLAAGRLHDPTLWKTTVKEIKARKKSYYQNPCLTKKLRLYLKMLSLPGLYRLFRKIIN